MSLKSDEGGSGAASVVVREKVAARRMAAVIGKCIFAASSSPFHCCLG